MTVANRAALIPSKGGHLKVTDVETSHPGPGEVLVMNHAIVIQPLDAKMLLAGYDGAGAPQSYPALLGSSGAGTVEELGEGVDNLAAGDRVVYDTRAYVKGDVNRREGTWQKTVIVDAKTVAKVGDAAFEQAVLINFPLQTAVAALHLFLGMATPGSGNSEERVLVWGAGGAVGSYAVQYAKSVGHTVVATASPRDVERQKRLGATEVVDYKAADAVDRLRQLGPYKYLFTASGDAASQAALAALLQPQGGKFASVLGGQVDLPPNVERVYTAFSQAAQKEEHSAWRDWWYGEYLPRVLQDGLVEPARFSKVSGGLAALQQASTDVFKGKVRGKIIVNPQE
ncbi:oxidoreductase domain-containing protein [Lentithecium fluviatile CBS 122367]|uniref:Oxidoreductase domain-containing protein n=1 Tax=Lentithecium fluviatile CBS 122367 TaxID=1168545 RepID=A0A6G1IZ59_9PLEO|nr:oxidoreductase domain-containing protein [Lentithecium fluviatile CBS 122367]